MPSLKVSSTDASMALMMFSGALKPRKARAFFLRKSLKISGLPRAGSTLSWRSRTRCSGRPSASICWAYSTAFSSSLPSSASASTTPTARASFALIGRPLVIISSATSGPTMRGRRWVPPAPGSRPRLTSGRPTFAEGTATRKKRDASACPSVAATSSIPLSSEAKAARAATIKNGDDTKDIAMTTPTNESVRCSPKSWPKKVYGPMR